MYAFKGNTAERRLPWGFASSGARPKFGILGILVRLTEATSNDIRPPALTCQSVASCAKEQGTLTVAMATDKANEPISPDKVLLPGGAGVILLNGPGRH